MAPRFDTATVTGDPTSAGVPILPQTGGIGGSGGGISGGGIGSGSAGGISGATGSALSSSAAGASGISTNPATSIGAPPALDADTGRFSNSSAGGSRGPKIVADEINHSLLITATRREFERIQRILERIDVMPVQVMLEAMIAEVTLTDQLKFGVKWHLERGNHSVTLSDAASGAVA